jgi:hypothetical protein
VKVCDKTCIFFFFPIINKYFLMAKRSYFLDAPRTRGTTEQKALIISSNVTKYSRQQFPLFHVNSCC